jgi:hypothetical protein
LGRPLGADALRATFGVALTVVGPDLGLTPDRIDFPARFIFLVIRVTWRIDCSSSGFRNT